MNSSPSRRKDRKLEHLKHSLEDQIPFLRNGLTDVHLVNHSVPELNWQEIDTSYFWLGKKLAQPLIINAITGGSEDIRSLNATLARAAARAGVAMAVGSQAIAILEAGDRESFQVVRKNHPHGVVLANLGANCTLEQAEAALEMVAADALQLHLNVPQELAMTEGDREFRGTLDNIARLAEALPVPVVVKEVGFGISREAALALFRSRASWLDVGGAGGTNFISIEQRRAGSENDMVSWGVPLVASLLEVKSLGLPVNLIASGGIASGLEVAKAIALGARLVGVAGHFLRTLVRQGEEKLQNELEQFARDLKAAMLMTASPDLTALAGAPLVVGGQVKEWLSLRGVDVSRLARR